MQVTIIHGQNHKGSSYHIGRKLLEKINNVTLVNEFFLPKDLNHFCLGCYKCIEGNENCPFFEEKNIIMHAVENSDLLIFTTPTYCLAPSAPIKSFIDLTFTYWMSHRPSKCMFSKKALVIATAAGTGAKQAVKQIKKTIFYWGVPWIKGYGISVQAMNWDGVSEKKKKKIESDVIKIANTVNRVKNPKVGIKTQFVFWMMGNMQKANWGSSPFEKQYWSEQGWLEKERPWKK